MFTDALCEDRRAVRIAGKGDNITCPRCCAVQLRRYRTCEACNVDREWQGDTQRRFVCPRCGS